MFVGNPKFKEATKDYVEHRIHEEIERVEGLLSEGSEESEGSQLSDDHEDFSEQIEPTGNVHWSKINPSKATINVDQPSELPMSRFEVDVQEPVQYNLSKAPINVDQPSELPTSGFEVDVPGPVQQESLGQLTPSKGRSEDSDSVGNL